MKVTIVTPTVRKDGLDVVRKALQNQAHKEWEWLIGSKFDPEIPEATWVKDTFEGGFWTLNRIYNELFRRSTCELIISWQDWIWVPPDGLDKFVSNYIKVPQVISGVGDQYERIGKYGKPEVKIWADPRKTTQYGSFYECNPHDAEWNWCALPKKAIYAVGGMDEGLDFLGYGGDQLSVVDRMDALGTLFYLDQTNESYTVRHGRETFGGQRAWDDNHVLFNGKYEEETRKLYEEGRWPNVGYLQESK